MTRFGAVMHDDSSCDWIVKSLEGLAAKLNASATDSAIRKILKKLRFQLTVPGCDFDQVGRTPH